MDVGIGVGLGVERELNRMGKILRPADNDALCRQLRELTQCAVRLAQSGKVGRWKGGG